MTISKKQRSMLPRTALVLIVIATAYYMYPEDKLSSHQGNSRFHFSSRTLLQDDDSQEVSDGGVTETPTVSNSSGGLNMCPDKGEEKADDQLFPPDLFSKIQLKNGAVILHIIGIIYMFYALALVCDEFFVPSLDVITERLGISPDVAGATFMAAGGSAPELFTSVIGVFIAQNDVGIGTIVGSAVFNILFVIAACAFAAKDALSLTAWPLIRDVFFYSVSLILLVVFFIDNKIMWWEALILFIWYFCYVGFMKWNEPAEDALRKLFGLPECDRGSLDRGCTIRKAAYRKGLFHLMNETINPGIISVMIGYQQGAAHLAAGPQGLTGLKSTLTNPDGSQCSTQENGKEMNEIEAPKVNNPETINPNEVSSSKDPDNGEVVGDNKETEEDKDDEEKEEEEEPIDMTFPKDKGWKAILVYLISFPIMAPLWLTLPDTKNKSKRKFFIITFFGSILWIAAYSYLMVWWATVSGDVIGIPPPVMGLTFLAAGTSVPDLITSVLVAKQGHGDMAVSSSVGSNIFDVTVGLPFPWLLYTIVNQSHVTVSADGIGCQIGMLFLMLLLVFLSILAFDWKMTKGMGGVMGGFYFIFVIVSLGFNYCWYICPIG